MFPYLPFVMRPGDERSLRESMLMHGPQDILDRLQTLVTDDLGPDERTDILQEIRGWERYIADFKPRRT